MWLKHPYQQMIWNCQRIGSVWPYFVHILQIKLNPTLMESAWESRKPRQKTFEREFTNVPERFIDKEGKPFHSSKSDLFKSQNTTSVMIRRVYLCWICKTCTKINGKHDSQARVNRLNIVFDTYLNDKVLRMLPEREEAVPIVFYSIRMTIV